MSLTFFHIKLSVSSTFFFQKKQNGRITPQSTPCFLATQTLKNIWKLSISTGIEPLSSKVVWSQLHCLMPGDSFRSTHPWPSPPLDDGPLFRETVVDRSRSIYQEDHNHQNPPGEMEVAVRYLCTSSRRKWPAKKVVLSTSFLHVSVFSSNWIISPMVPGVFTWNTWTKTLCYVVASFWGTKNDHLYGHSNFPLRRQPTKIIGPPPQKSQQSQKKHGLHSRPY